MSAALGAECTGVAADWCPIHGDCTCRKRIKASGSDGRCWARDRCPLHGSDSTHPNDSWSADPLDVLRATLTPKDR